MTAPDDVDPIAASLRRQFSPPALDELHERIAAEAGRRPAPPSTATSRAPGRWAVAAAFAVAAALVLWILRPPPNPKPATPPIPAVTEDPEAPVLVPPTRARRAGAELDGFLDRGDRLPATSGALVAPEVCDTEAGHPQLIADAGIVLVGECGGMTQTPCAAHDLPADRAMLVRLASGEHAILCIERPWTDPRPELPEDSDYRVFRSELGDYVIYEVTPASGPEASQLLRL